MCKSAEGTAAAQVCLKMIPANMVIQTGELGQILDEQASDVGLANVNSAWPPFTSTEGQTVQEQPSSPGLHHLASPPPPTVTGPGLVGCGDTVAPTLQTSSILKT